MSTTSDPTDLARIQRRTIATLVAGQVLGGLGIGATLSIGAVLAAELSGTEALSGAAATLSTLGAAGAAIPLARLVQRVGRRGALIAGVLAACSGASITILAVALASFPLLLLGFALLGTGSAVNLQSRFAAADLADERHRGRAISIVVWSTTVGAVAGPNLIGPGEALAAALGMPHLTGSFIIAVAAQLSAAVVYFFALRPDPYLLSRTAIARPVAQPVAGAVAARTLVILAIVIISVSHAVMVSVMSMTPVHLTHVGVQLGAIGFTISLHIAGMYALSPVFGWLSDRLGRIPTVLVGQALFAASVVIVALGEGSQLYVTIGLTLLGLGWSASTVAGSALVADLVSGSERPRIQGRSDLSMNISGAVGGAAAGPVLALVGYAGLAWVAGALVVALTITVLIVTSARRVTPTTSAADDQPNSVVTL